MIIRVYEATSFMCPNFPRRWLVSHVCTHRIHGAAIYGVPWIPSIYHLSINIPAPWIRVGIFYSTYCVITVPTHPIFQCRTRPRNRKFPPGVRRGGDVSGRVPRVRYMWKPTGATVATNGSLTRNRRFFVVIPVTRRASRDHPAEIGDMGMVGG